MVAKKRFNIPSKSFDVFFIAEAGVNHNGKKNLALKLVRAAAKAGADAVKFQAFKADQVVTEEGKMASYQKKNIGKIKSQREMLAELEFKEPWYPEIVAECKKQGIMFMSTPHGGRESVKVLNPFVEVWKVGSGDLLNFILLDEIAKTKKPVILSTGMHDLSETTQAVNFLKRGGYKENMMSVLHCTTNYPCPLDQVNLASMVTMVKKLKGIAVGYSDHTMGPQVAIMATTLGAKVYECHFTLDKKMPGPDHAASVEPDVLKEKILMVRQVSKIMGDASKKPSNIEIRQMRPVVTKSIVATKNLSVGHIIAKEDLEAKRPGDGISPSEYEKFIGKKLKKPLIKDQKLTTSHIQ